MVGAVETQASDCILLIFWRAVHISTFPFVTFCFPQTFSIFTFSAWILEFGENARTQFLILASELQVAGVTPGTITNIGFFVQ